LIFKRDYTLIPPEGWVNLFKVRITRSAWLILANHFYLFQGQVQSTSKLLTIFWMCQKELSGLAVLQVFLSILQKANDIIDQMLSICLSYNDLEEKANLCKITIVVFSRSHDCDVFQRMR